MAQEYKFERLEVWKLSLELSDHVYDIAGFCLHTSCIIYQVKLKEQAPRFH